VSAEPLPSVICLTLPEQRERQLAVAQEFEKVGIRNYEFYPGFVPTADEVKRAYAQGRVKRYPDCFRCGQRDCGRADCNNVLIPAQVAVALGFQAILRRIAGSAAPYALVCEDDIVFAGCARAVFASDQFRNLVRTSNLHGEEPVLVRLGRPSIERDFFSTDTARAHSLRLTDEVVMSNTCFLANRAFAQLATKRLESIDHTADVVIHQFLMNAARCHTLNVQLVGDRSWSLGDTPSLIHPKPHYLAHLQAKHGASSPQAQAEAARIGNHMKKAVSRP
jgi:hypothetical protein